MPINLQPDGKLSDSARPDPRRWLVFGLCANLFICSQFFRVSNAIIAPHLIQELQLDSEQLGLLGAAFFYAFALAQLPLALWLDRLGARWIMAALTLTGALGALIFASAHTMHGAMIGRIMLGLGMACNLMGSMKLFTRWFSAREFATLSGLMLALGTLGNMLAATPLAMLVEAAGWRWAFSSIGLFTALSGAVFFVLVRDDPATPAAPSLGRPPSLREMAQTLFLGKEYWIISCGTFFRYGAFVAIQGLWAGPYLMEVQGMSAVEAGNYLLLINLGLILGSPLGGWLSDRVLGTRKWVAAAGLAGVGVCELALALWPGGEAPALLGAVMLWLGVSSAFGIVMYAHIKEVMPPEMSGLALTGVNFFTMVGGGVFLHVMGLVLDVYSEGGAPDAQGYSAAFLMSAAAIGLALGLYIFTRDAAPRKA